MKKPLWQLTLGAVLVFASVGDLTAQGSFEVASIRPKDPKASQRPSSRVSPTHVEWVSAAPMDLLQRAYSVERFQVVDMPSWARTERYDIRATLPLGALKQDVPEMLRALLAERFGLKVRSEKRSTPVYELKVGPSTPRIRDVLAIDELAKTYVGDPKIPVAWDRISGLPGDELREIADRDTYHVITAETSYWYRQLSNGVREYEAVRVRMPQLRNWLAGVLDRPVLDRTGLTGLYQLRIVLPPIPRDPAAPGPIPRTLPEPSGVSVFRSVENLGLILERIDAPLDYVVVERIDKPTPN